MQLGQKKCKLKVHHKIHIKEYLYLVDIWNCLNCEIWNGKQQSVKFHTNSSFQTEQKENQSIV